MISIFTNYNIKYKRVFASFILPFFAAIISPIAVILSLHIAKDSLSPADYKDFVLMLRYASVLSAICMSGLGSSLMKFNKYSDNLDEKNSSSFIASVAMVLITIPLTTILYKCNLIVFSNTEAIYSLVSYSVYVTCVAIHVTILRSLNHANKAAFASIVFRSAFPFILIWFGTLFNVFTVLLLLASVFLYIALIWKSKFKLDFRIIEYGMKRMFGDLLPPLLFALPVYWLNFIGKTLEAVQVSLKLAMLTAIIVLLSPIVDLVFANIAKIVSLIKFSNLVIATNVIGLVAVLIISNIPEELLAVIGIHEPPSIEMLIFIFFYVQVYFLQPFVDYISNKQLLVLSYIIAILIVLTFCYLLKESANISLLFISMFIATAMQYFILLLPVRFKFEEKTC